MTAHIGNVTSRQQNLGDRLFELPKQVVPQRYQPPLPNSCERLVAKLQLASVFTERENQRTCFPERLSGFFIISMRLRPTAIAPELTSATLCPSRFRCTTVSTIAERVDSSVWCVVSWTIEEDPMDRLADWMRFEWCPRRTLRTKLDHDGA